MDDHTILGRIHLGYAPVVDRQREVIAQQVTIFPGRSESLGDIGFLLRSLQELVTPNDRSASAISPIQLLLSAASETLLDGLLQGGLPAEMAPVLPSFLAAAPRRLAAMQAHGERGGSLALTGRSLDVVPPDLLRRFRVVMTDIADLDLGVGPLALPPGVSQPLLIDGVSSPDQADRALSSPVAGVVGWPTGERVPSGTTAAPKALAPNIKTIVELMNMVERQESVDAMERVLKGDTALALKLLQLINSPAFGLRVEVTSFRHAMMLLGHLRLKRWLALLLASSVKQAGSQPLLYLSVRRGFLMEELALAAGQDDLRGEMFICGMFSLLDRLLGQSFGQLLEYVPMPARVQLSLTREGGPYEGHIKLVEAVEQSSLADIRDTSESLLISPHDLNRCILSALRSARELDV